MKTKDRPMESHTSVIGSFMNYAEVDEKDREVLKKELKRYIELRVKRKWCSPYITKFHTDWYREFYNLVGSQDPYKKLKEWSNEEAKKVLNQFKPKNLREILLLTIMGNKIDFGACLHGLYDITSLEKDCKNIDKETLFIDDTKELENQLKTAKNIFYLFDNNGELIFDKLLVEFIKKTGEKNIFLVGKEKPMLNDVTTDDLKKEGFGQLGKIISTGSNCFGLHEEDVSIEFKKIFGSADLIIAKGQAYFEFFMEYNFTNVINILRVKQEIIGDNIPRLNPGMNIIMSSSRYAGNGLDYVWEPIPKNKLSLYDTKIADSTHTDSNTAQNPEK